MKKGILFGTGIAVGFGAAHIISDFLVGRHIHAVNKTMHLFDMNAQEGKEEKIEEMIPTEKDAGPAPCAEPHFCERCEDGPRCGKYPPACTGYDCPYNQPEEVPADDEGKAETKEEV